jgi:hypothetical protein
MMLGFVNGSYDLWSAARVSLSAVEVQVVKLCVYRTEWWFVTSCLLYSCGCGYFYMKYVVQFFRLQVLFLRDKSNVLGR